MTVAEPIERALANSATVPLELYLKTVELALRLGATAEVRAAINQLLLLHPHALAPQLLLGQLLVEEDEARLALPHFARVLKHHPFEPAAWLGLAISHQARGDAAAAELALIRSQEFAPVEGPDEQLDAEERHPVAHALLALRADQGELAVLSLRRIRQVEPDRPELAILEAEALRRLGETAAARSLMTTLLSDMRDTLAALLVRAALLAEHPAVGTLRQRIAALDVDGRYTAQFFAPGAPPWDVPACPRISWPERAGMLPELAEQVPELKLAWAQQPPLPQQAQPGRRAGAGGAGVSLKRASGDLAAAGAPAQDSAVVDLAAVIEQRRSRMLSRTGVRPLQPWQIAERSVQLLVTSRRALMKKYGEAGYTAIAARLGELAAALHERAVPTELCIVDDPASLRAYPGLAPAAHEAPAIAGLLQGLERRVVDSGRALRVVTLIGGDDIVPFHRLPNESDDADGPTLSDLPYGGGDSAQVLPRWVVARIPDAADDNPGYLLQLLDQLIGYHRGWQTPSTPGYGCLMPSFGLLQRGRAERGCRGFGMSAAIWREASEAIYGQLASDAPLRFSPPEEAASFRSDWLHGRRLLYFNLHGAHGSPNWYGEASLEDLGSERLPIALTPLSIDSSLSAGSIVISEACYGAEIVERNASNAIALRMLEHGALAFVGSTVTAYGAPGPPLAAADLFVNNLCRRLSGGEPAGLAFHAAREDFIRAIYHEHGFMDGDDLKTLQSFVLYGDPWAALSAEPALATTPKSALILPFLARERRPLGEGQLPSELLVAIRQRISSLLPGALARVTIALEPLSLNGAKGGAGRQALVVNAEQQVSTQDGRLVTRVAHLTLVRKRLVKTVVSR